MDHFNRDLTIAAHAEMFGERLTHLRSAEDLREALAWATTASSQTGWT
jgi:hypothetical protein